MVLLFRINAGKKCAHPSDQRQGGDWFLFMTDLHEPPPGYKSAAGYAERIT